MYKKMNKYAYHIFYVKHNNVHNALQLFRRTVKKHVEYAILLLLY